MNNRGIDDILIDASERKNSSPKKIIVILLFLIIIIGIGVYYAYYYLKSKEEPISYKNLFFEKFSEIDIEKYFTNNMVEKIYTSLLTSDYEMDNAIKVTNTLENFDDNYYLKDIDVSKFDIDANIKRNIEKARSLSDININYLGNSIFNFKTIITDNEIALFSNDIYEKYVAIDYDNINNLFNTNINTNLLKNNDRLEITKKDLIRNYDTYKEIALGFLTEDMFSSNENYVIHQEENDIEVTSYELTIPQDNLKNIIIEILEEIKGNDELIDKLITGKDELTVLNLDNPPIIQNFYNNVF